MPQIFVEHGSPEWNAMRTGRITASLAADCLGLTKKSRAWAKRTILGLEQQDDNAFMKYGRDNERNAILAYEMETGRCADKAWFWIHDDYDWLAASPDALVGKDGILECKCPARLPKQIPPAHRVQMLVQLFFFLHMDEEAQPRWNMMALCFALLVVAIVVGGTLWIMSNLSHGQHDTATPFIEGAITPAGSND